MKRLQLCVVLILCGFVSVATAQRYKDKKYKSEETITKELSFNRSSSDNIVVDIGRATDALKATLAPLRYKNLDEIPEFQGQNTTTEFLAKHIFDQMALAIAAGDLGPGSDKLLSMKVELGESHTAWAAYEGYLS